MATAYLTAHRLRQLFHYSLITGEFYRKIRVAAHKAGGIAGSIRTDGYRSIKINGRSLLSPARMAVGEWGLASR
jgi:hypothetical protein